MVNVSFYSCFDKLAGKIEMKPRTVVLGREVFCMFCICLSPSTVDCVEVLNLLIPVSAHFAS